MKLLLVVNPLAAALTAKRRIAVEDLLAADHDLSVAVTRAKDHATELARQAADQGFDAVLVLAGDGTLNEAANGLAGTSTALAPLPAGSTNVFARTIGLSRDATEAAAQIKAALAKGSRRRIEMGTANGRHFLFHVGMGFDATIVERVERRSWLKQRAGQAVFVSATVTTLLGGYHRTAPRFELHLGGEAVIEDVAFALCLKNNPYTFLGNRPLSVAPEAGLGRNLAVVALQDVRRLTVVRALAAAMRDAGRLPDLPGVVLRSDVEHLTVIGRSAFAHQMDGEYLGRVETLELGLDPGVLDLVVP